MHDEKKKLKSTASLFSTIKVQGKHKDKEFEASPTPRNKRISNQFNADSLVNSVGSHDKDECEDQSNHKTHVFEAAFFDKIKRDIRGAQFEI